MFNRFAPRAALLAGAAALLLAAPAAQAGALVPNKTTDIKFTGFCDGMHLVINEGTGVVTGNSTGSCITPTPFVGTVGGNAKLGAGVAVLEGGLLYVIDDSPQNFTLYGSGGSVLINAGSYTVGVAAAGAAGPATNRATSGRH